MTAPEYTPPPDGWRTFLIVWVTQSASLLGSALTLFALTVWLTVTVYPAEAQKPQLAWAIAALALSYAVPTVIVAPIAGAWADRHDRRRTMLWMDLASFLLSLVLAALIALGRLPLAALIVLGALQAAFRSFHEAAFDTSYAMLVPADKLPRANGMMRTIQSLSGILAPGLAAALIVLPALARQGRLPAFAAFLGAISDGAVLAIGLDAVTFLLAAAALLLVQIPSPVRADLQPASGAGPSLWADVREGALYIWHRRSFLWLLGTFTVVNFAAGALVLQPLLVKFQLAPDWSPRGFTLESALALLATVGSLGGVAGGFIVSTWGGLQRRRIYGVLVPMIVFGAALMVFGASRTLLLTAAAAAVLEGMGPVMDAHSQTIWQIQTPHELQGRVFAVRRLIAQFSWPAATFLMGALASRFDPGRLIVVLGAAAAVWCVAGLFNPQLRRVEDREWIEAQALKNAGRAPADGQAAS
jgi:MFS family permease